MTQHPLPGGGPDGAEPPGSALPPPSGTVPPPTETVRAAAGAVPPPARAVPEDDWDAEAAIGALVAAADAGAGEWDLTPDWLAGDDLPLSGFRCDAPADVMGPGPVLAALVHAATRDEQALAGLDEDQLVGVIAAVRRLESRMAWAAMTALRELTARRRAAKDQVTCGRTQVSATAADQVAMELRQSWQSVVGQIAYACEVAARLPKTFAALAAGLIHPVHVRIIEDETRFLSDEDAARADETLAQAAQSKSFGELRYAAHRLALKLDPASAARRKEAARRDAQVRRFREESGNAGMIARELPSADVLASWQHIDQRARDLRAAGVDGTLQELRVKAYLDLLQERDSRPASDAPPGPPAPQAGQPGNPSGSPHHGDAPDGRGRASSPGGGPSGPGGEAPGGPGVDAHGARGGPRSGPDGTGGPGRGPAGAPPPAGGKGNARPAAPGADPGVAALITLTVPLATALGQSGAPGEVAGFGLLDAADTRDLIAAAARHPRTRWCLTVLQPDGTAAAHGCAPGRHPVPPDLSRFMLTTVIRGPCDHAQAEPHYRPSRKLQHLVTARSTQCTAPGCARPAARCDLDHTDPWDNGGLTCPCNLAPLCRHHHKCKQSDGWILEQPEPGVLHWRTPAGRTYTTTPTVYPAASSGAAGG
jgi:hypothetical protein